MDHLRGKIALVTGAGRGLGRAIALELARAGASCALSARSSHEIEAVATLCEELGGRAFALAGDICNHEFRRHLCGRIEANLGPVDILINNAGVAPAAPLKKTSDELWATTMALNLEAPFALSGLVMRGMKERGYGRIVNIASTAALKGYAYTTAYVASKHGLLGLTRALSREGAPFGVTVNAVCPGFADTKIAADAVANIIEKTGRSAEEARGTLTTENPMGRLVRPDEVAAAVMTFLSPASDAISGQALAVSGGATEG